MGKRREYPGSQGKPAEAGLPALPPRGGPLFFGRFLHALDDKRRVAIPKAFREEIAAAGESEAELFLVRGLDRCLWLFTRESFRGFARNLETLNDAGKQGHEQLRQLRRDIYSNGARLAPDKQGRVVLPLELCELVGIGREVLFCGVDDRLEVWSPEADEVRNDADRHRRNSRDVVG